MFERFRSPKESASINSELLAKRENVGKVIQAIAYKIEAPAELEGDEAILQFNEQKYAEVDRIMQEARNGNLEPAKEWMAKNNDQIDVAGRGAFAVALAKIEQGD